MAGAHTAARRTADRRYVDGGPAELAAVDIAAVNAVAACNVVGIDQTNTLDVVAADTVGAIELPSPARGPSDQDYCDGVRVKGYFRS